jgi:hypothetical protein
MAHAWGTGVGTARGLMRERQGAHHGNAVHFADRRRARYILLNLRDEMCVKQKSSLCSLQKDEAPKTKLKLLIAVMLTLSVFKI